MRRRFSPPLTTESPATHDGFPPSGGAFSGFGTKMALWAMWQVAIMGIRIPMTMHYKPFQARPAHPTSGHSYHI